MFGCYGIITCCCKSYHKATVKFSSNPTISFSSKSTRKDPPVKSDQNKAISVHVLWVSFHHRSTPVLSSSHQKINPEGKYYTVPSPYDWNIDLKFGTSHKRTILNLTHARKKLVCCANTADSWRFAAIRGVSLISDTGLAPRHTAQKHVCDRHVCWQFAFQPCTTIEVLVTDTQQIYLYYFYKLRCYLLKQIFKLPSRYL